MCFEIIGSSKKRWSCWKKPLRARSPWKFVLLWVWIPLQVLRVQFCFSCNSIPQRISYFDLEVNYQSALCGLHTTIIFLWYRGYHSERNMFLTGQTFKDFQFHRSPSGNAIRTKLTEFALSTYGSMSQLSSTWVADILLYVAILLEYLVADSLPMS